MSREPALPPFGASVPLQIDYARELNAQQYAAVTAPPGPSLVIAGAGSGKTRALIYRVAYLLEQGIPPNRILLLTFTNKAAQEMMRRTADLLGRGLAALWGGTFHALGNRVLRRHADQLGYSRDFTILDSEDARRLITACMTEAEVNAKDKKFPKAEVLADLFSLAVNTRQPLSAVLRDQHGRFARLEPQIRDLQQRYAARKRAINALDFDDLLAQWLRLMREHPEIGEQYQRRFQFILVDEYQDTNPLQGELIDLLAARHQNVMAVGDDAQSIYGWRGASCLNILKFPERYPAAKVYKIETNYRSTPEILRVANAAIVANVHQFAKELAPARPAGGKPWVVVCADATEQGDFVARRVAQLRAEGGRLSRMAVLYRAHFHALELQLELTHGDIPFSITSGIRFFEQAHIKDVTAYVKLVANPRDELSFKRLALALPGIGAKGADKLWRAFAAGAPTPPPARPAAPPADGPDAPGIPPPEPSLPLAARLRACGRVVPKKAAAAWAQLAATLEQLAAEDVRDDVAAMIGLVKEAGYADYLASNYTNPEARLEELKQLAIFARQFPTTTDFLTQLALLTNLEAESESPARADEDRLRLSTIHQAKGLEFDVVFVIMLCDGLFPLERALASPAGEEEERRLMYVAITRARNELYLCYPRQRAAYGSGGGLAQWPSRFLQEIPRKLLKEWELPSFERDE